MRPERIGGYISKPVTFRTARNYIAAAHFQARYAKEYPEIMELSLSRLYSLTSLPDSEVVDLLKNGLVLADGSRCRLAEAQAKDIRTAAAAIRARLRLMPMPHQIQKALAKLQAQAAAAGIDPAEIEEAIRVSEAARQEAAAIS